MTLLPCSMFQIGFLQGSGHIYAIMTVNIVMMIIFLSGTMTIKNERLKKSK